MRKKKQQIFVENKRIKPQRIDRNGKLNNSLRKFSHIHFLDIRKIKKKNVNIRYFFKHVKTPLREGLMNSQKIHYGPVGRRSAALQYL